MPLISPADAPVHETPNASMRTLAAPSLGTQEVSVWEVAMRAGQRGPEHRMDREQVWVVLDGELHIEIDGLEVTARAGDTVQLPGATTRRIAAALDARALVASPAAPEVTTEDGITRPLPWAA